MAAAMLAAYPDVFSGGAVIAGIPYASALNVQQARTTQSSLRCSDCGAEHEWKGTPTSCDLCIRFTLCGSRRQATIIFFMTWMMDVRCPSGIRDKSARSDAIAPGSAALSSCWPFDVRRTA